MENGAHLQGKVLISKKQGKISPPCCKITVFCSAGYGFIKDYSKQIAFTNTLYDLYTYKTIILSDFDIPYTDALIFTSPSNVEAYIRKYKIDARQAVIAMGQTTKFKLAQAGIKNILMPTTFDEEGLYTVLCKTISLR